MVRTVEKPEIKRHQSGTNPAPFFIWLRHRTKYAHNDPIDWTDPSGEVVCGPYELTEDQKREEAKRVDGCKCRIAEGPPKTGYAWVECDGKGNGVVAHRPQKGTEKIPGIEEIGGPIHAACHGRCGAKACTECHEKHHILQSKALAPDLCKGKPKGGHFQIERECADGAECFAHTVGLNCLIATLKRLQKRDRPCNVGRKKYSCKSYIRNVIDEKTKAVQKQHKCEASKIKLPKP